MSMKIRGKVVAEMSLIQLEGWAGHPGKAGEHARAEIKRRTGKEIARPPKGTKAPKFETPVANDDAKEEAA
ncbi:MAG: hypothetical protein OEZ43_20645 [Gammaproteobacteria bacterium]|nr:hypothetical protein [Gammaproteobacteria bacterium]